MKRKKEPVTTEIATVDVKREEIFDFVKDWVTKSVEYRDIFTPRLNEIEAQINMTPPASWAGKESWQTKISLPIQANGSETAYAKMKKILFSGTSIFEIAGVEKSDEEKMQALTTLMQTLMGVEFERENDSVLQEACDLGDGFMRLLVKPTKDGVNWKWRSIWNGLLDPGVGKDFTQSKGWCDEFKKDLGDIIQEVKDRTSLYDIEQVDKMLADIRDNPLGAPDESEADKSMATIKSYDGTFDIELPRAYKEVLMYEWWGRMKVPVDKKDEEHLNDTNEYGLEWRVVTLAKISDRYYLLRNSKNEYGFIPVAKMPIKPRKYEAYSKGFLNNGVSLKELADSMVNLGFDSLKMCSMDIIIVDKSKVAQWSSIEYKPMAVWAVTDINAVKFTRQAAQSALMEILKAVNFIDAMYQDATALTRSAGGQPTLAGQDKAETLGEYQLKLQAVEDKLLAVAKTVEACYAKPLLQMLYRIITNPNLFTQEACDRILGMDDVLEPQIDPATGEPMVNGETGEPVGTPTKKSKLVLADLDPNMELDFRLIGVTQMQELLGIKASLMQFLQIIAENPIMANYIKPEGMIKQIAQALRLPNTDVIIKSADEIKAMEEQMRQQPQEQPTQ